MDSTTSHRKEAYGTIAVYDKMQNYENCVEIWRNEYTFGRGENCDFRIDEDAVADVCVVF